MEGRRLLQKPAYVIMKRFHNEERRMAIPPFRNRAASAKFYARSVSSVGME